jgi:FixJ family two-component response regulator
MNFNYTTTVRSSSKPPEAPTVFIVDGDASARATLESLIRSAGWQVKSMSSAEEFLSSPRTMAPACLLADVDLPGLSGLDLQERVSERAELPLIFLSGSIDIRATVRAMKGGAFDFLTKPFVRDALVQAIGLALERSQVELNRLARSQALQGRYELLSRREREVMTLVVAGRLNKQVGGELGISEITVKAHRGKLMRKMQAGSFAELVRMAASLRRYTGADVPQELIFAVRDFRSPLASHAM